MIQALDLARENAVLKDEVDRLRRAVTQLAGTGESTRVAAATTGWPDELDGRRQASDDGRTTARLMVIMPRWESWSYELLADRFARVPHCEVIVDRRVMERRHGHAVPPVAERRRGERRANDGDPSASLVVSVVPVELGRGR